MQTEQRPDRFPDSPYARERLARFGRLRFAPEIEGEFEQSHLHRARGRVRAWHSTVMLVLLFTVIPLLLASNTPGEVGLVPNLAAGWSGSKGNVLLLVLAANTVARAVLLVLAWSPWFERVYPRVAFPLVASCHACWTFACSGEILGSHPEYLAPLVTDAFAAYFFSGLLFRQAVGVSLMATAGLLGGGYYVAGSLAPILFFGTHFFTNIVMACIAGFAHERSARGLFLEHALLIEMAALDGLTGLKNRREFDEHLALAWQQALRDGKPLGILMIDVDEFKHYNDRYGHQAGDRALQRIADVVAASCRRPLDMTARYGGEELAVVMYDPTRQQVLDTAARLLEGVEQLGIEHEDSTAGVVTVSVGVAIVQPTGKRRPQGALQLADQALYDAKRGGRNRIVVLEHEYHDLSTGAFKAIASAR